MLARPGLPGFDYLRPASAGDASRLLLEHGPAAKLLMGGTDLFPRMRDGLLSPRWLVDVKGLPGLRDIRYDAHDGLTVGAATSLNALARQADVVERYPLLAEAAASIASYQVRNRATLGGNLCNASPAADMAPAVLCLEAQVVLHGPAGSRSLPAAGFFLGPGKTALEPGELMVAVCFPVPRPQAVGQYRKLGRNRAGDLAIVGVAVVGWPDPSSDGGYGFAIGLASVAPVPMRAVAAEELLAHHPPEGRWLRAAADAAAESARPIDDLRASAAYRREMVSNLALRGLEEVTARLRGAGAGHPGLPRLGGAR